MPGPQTGGLFSGPNLESWTYWWSFNKERFLKLYEKIGKFDGPVTSDPESSLINNRGARSSMRPTPEQLAAEVTPALVVVLQKETDPQILAAAMISAAKIGEKPADVIEQLKKLLAHSNTTVCENAALSLGILGSPDAIALLKSLYEDSDDGRKLCGLKAEVPWRVRTLSAFALGLAAAHTKNPHHHKAIRELLLNSLSTLSSGKKTHDDIAVATILALSMFEDAESASSSGLEKFFVENYKRMDLICSHIPPAVGKLYANGNPNDRERYTRSLVSLSKSEDRSVSRLIRCGMAIAFGLLTTSGDAFSADVTKDLRAAVEERIARYPEAAYLSIISLGEIAGTGAPGGDIEKFLVERATADGGRVTSRAWSALALGIEGFLQIERGVPLPPANDTVSQMLELRMLEVRDPEQKAAFGVALGLRRALPAAESLLKCIENVRVDDLRGYFALALGMMNARQHAPIIQEIVKNSTRKPGYFQQAAIGLGLMGDKTVVPILIQILRDAKSQAFIVESAIADSLGYVGDYRAVAPLLELLKDEKKERTSIARTFAAVALGLIGDKDAQPWNTRISQQLNYFSFVETLTDLIWEQ